MRQCPVASVDWSLRRLLCVLCLLQGVCAGGGGGGEGLGGGGGEGVQREGPGAPRV